jgi:hypothetical protein
MMDDGNHAQVVADTRGVDERRMVPRRLRHRYVRTYLDRYLARKAAAAARQARLVSPLPNLSPATSQNSPVCCAVICEMQTTCIHRYCSDALGNDSLIHESNLVQFRISMTPIDPFSLFSRPEQLMHRT